MAEIIHVSADEIIMKGVVPEENAFYDGKDPLDRACWIAKSELLKKHKVCFYYQIERKVDPCGERSIKIIWYLSYTGRFEDWSIIPEEEQLVWKNMFSARVAELIEAFLIDDGMGQKCELLKDPEMSLKINQEELKKLEAKEKFHIPATADKSSMEESGFRKATSSDMAVLPNECFEDEDKKKK